jgi:sirohydrochlorin cobaltochelatase
MLWEGMGFGWAETAYSGVTFPLVTPALAHAARLGYRRIVVFPYFLFTGVLVKRIYDAAEEAQAKYPGIEILTAPYLDDHPLVIDTFLDRIREMLVGQNLMNCALCKYREQVLGFEADVGLAQQSHHHHVEGIGGGLENCPCNGDCDSSCRDKAFCEKHGLPWTPLHTHDHEHHHHHPHGEPIHPHALLAQTGLTRFGGKGDGEQEGHHHHHQPYPFAAHPLGPVTLPKVPGKLARRDREQ